MEGQNSLIRKMVRILLLAGLFAALLIAGKKKWAEYSEVPAGERFSHPQYRAIVRLYRKVAEVLPFASAHFALAESYMDEGVRDRAVEEYKKTVGLDKKFTQAYIALASIYLNQDRPGEALVFAQEAEKLDPANADIKALKKEAAYANFLNTGVKAFEDGDRTRARELLKQALAEHPDSAQLHYLIALSFNEQQDFSRVEEHLKAAIRLDPKHCLSRSFLGDIYFGQSDFDGAIGEYKQFLDTCGEDPMVLNNMGLAYMNLERYGSAIPVLERSLALNPGNINTLHNLTNLYRDYGNLDKAIQGYVQLEQLRPDDLNVYVDLGDIYRKQDRKEEALKQYRMAIEQGQRVLSQGQRKPAFLVALAHAYNGAQEFETAKDLVEESLRRVQDDPKAYLTLADSYRGLKHFDLAMVALGKAKQVSSGNTSYIDDAIRRNRQDLVEQRGY